MQKIELIRRLIIILSAFLLFITLLIEYSFNIQFFHQVVIITFNLVIFSVFAYVYFNPEFVIQKRKEIILLIISILVLLILMETTLRINDCGWGWEFSPDEALKYKYEKSTKICNHIEDGNQIFSKKFYVMSNNEGFIDDDFEFNEEDYNIFLIGDSFAACLESDYNNCVHQKLEKDLKKEYGENINIMNFGVSSYGGLAELEILKKYEDEYEPKMILLYFFADNDMSENKDYYTKEYVQSKSKTLIREITPKTLLFIMTNGKNILDRIFVKFESYRVKTGLEEQYSKSYEAYLEEYNSEWQELLEIELDSIEEIYEISLEENITLLHVAVTSKEQVYEEDWKQIFETYLSSKDKTYILSKPNDIVMNFAEENGVHHLDLVPLFKENPEYLHLPIDGHWNDEGQLFAGEKIKEYIIENNLIKNV
jgi:hypothetical protein